MDGWTKPSWRSGVLIRSSKKGKGSWEDAALPTGLGTNTSASSGGGTTQLLALRWNVRQWARTALLRVKAARVDRMTDRGCVSEAGQYACLRSGEERRVGRVLVHTRDKKGGWEQEKARQAH